MIVSTPKMLQDGGQMVRERGIWSSNTTVDGAQRHLNIFAREGEIVFMVLKSYLMDLWQAIEGSWNTNLVSVLCVTLMF